MLGISQRYEKNGLMNHSKSHLATISKEWTYKSFRIISFAHPHHLTPFLSHLSKNRGEGEGVRNSILLKFQLVRE